MSFLHRLCAKHSTECFTYSINIPSSQPPHRVGIITLLLFRWGAVAQMLGNSPKGLRGAGTTPGELSDGPNPSHVVYNVINVIHIFFFFM